MSSLLDKLREAKENGALDEFRSEEELPKRNVSPQQAPITQPKRPSLPPEVVDAVMETQDEASTSEVILGTGLGAATEIGLGIGMTYKLHRSQKYLKWLNNAKRVSALGVVAPEGASTVAGAVGYAASEAAIWGLSNLAGQSVRQAFGLEDKYSAGEAIAASAFGVGVVATGADKIFKLADGVGAMRAWKGRTLLVNGTKTFVSGAVLGLAESTLRQEVEILLNEKESRNVYDYVFSSAAGGTFNTLFSVWARTGKWGRNQAKKAVTGALTRLEAHKNELKAQLRDPDKKTPGVSILSGGGRIPSVVRRQNAHIEKEIAKIEQAQESIKDTLKGLENADEALTKGEAQTEPVKKPEVEEVKEPEVKEPEVTTPKAEEPAAPKATEEEPTPTPVSDDPREASFNNLSERTSQLNSENLTTELPRIEREAKKLYNSTYDNIETSVRKLVKNPTDTEALNALLGEVVFLRKLNTQVKDVAETTAGRTLQAARMDADKYRWEAKYSFRSQEEDAALAVLEQRLRGMAEGSEGADLQKLFDDFAGIKPRLKAKGKKIDKQVTKDAKKRTKKPLTEAQKAEKLKQALVKNKEKLQKELDELRGRFGDDEKLDEAQAAALKKKKEEDPKVKDLKARIKFYKDAEAEVAKIEQLQAQLARLADIEGRSVISELKDVTSKKPTGPVKPSKVNELRAKIAASKKRMRDKLKDLETAGGKAEEERMRALLFRDLEEAFYKALETDGTSAIGKGFRWLNQARQLALIDQLPSAMAGVPTGAGAGVKQFFRPVATFLYNFTSKGVPVATRLAMADAAGAFKMLTDLKGLWGAVKRTAVEGLSATDRQVGKLTEDINPSALPRGPHALVAKARASAERRSQAIEAVGNKFAKYAVDGFWQILSLGVRGIQGIDEAFKRQLIKGRLWAESNKKAILEFPDNPMKARKKAEELYESAWVDSDGLEILNSTHEFFDEVRQVREELLFAGNAENLDDVYENGAEKVVKALKKLAGEDSVVGYGIQAIMPYIGVPIRGAYRMGRLFFPPALILKQGPLNPYNKIIKEIRRDLTVLENFARRKDLDANKLDSLNDEIAQLRIREETAIARRAKYNQEALTDLFVGTALTSFAAYWALKNGSVTGSLSWMTRDQREKTKMKPNRAFGGDYTAAMPWSAPLQSGADLATWTALKDSGILTKDQTFPMVLRSSIVNLLREQPLSQGVKTTEEIFSGEREVYEKAVARMIGSYIPVPAQARKITKTILDEGGVPDLRGQGFFERVAYEAFGTGKRNFKTDRFGNQLETSKTWITETIVRQAPQKEVFYTDVERIIATDMHNNITPKPTRLGVGIKMTDYRDVDGLTLETLFNERLKETRIRKRGKRLTMEEAAERLIYENKWIKKFEKGFMPSENNPDRIVNEGLLELNTLFREYYKETQKKMLKDKKWLLSDFINQDEEYLLDVLEQNDFDFKVPQDIPLSPLDVLGIE